MEGPEAALGTGTVMSDWKNQRGVVVVVLQACTARLTEQETDQQQSIREHGGHARRRGQAGRRSKAPAMRDKRDRAKATWMAGDPQRQPEHPGRLRAQRAGQEAACRPWGVLGPKQV